VVILREGGRLAFPDSPTRRLSVGSVIRPGLAKEGRFREKSLYHGLRAVCIFDYSEERQVLLTKSNYVAFHG